MNKMAMVFFFVLSISSVKSYAISIEYEFSGFIIRMFEHDGASGDNTNVSSSSLFGFDIEVGDSFFGSFAYDAEATESDYRANYPDSNSAVFQNAVLDFRFVVGDYIYEDKSPAGILDSLVLSNDTDIGHKDAFSVQSSNSLDEYYSSASMGFFDSIGDAFSDFSLPTALSVSDFLGYGYFHSALLNRDSSDQLHFYGHANTLVAKVDEPNPLLLLSIGLVGLVGRNALTKRSPGRASLCS